MPNKETEVRLTCPYCEFKQDGFYNMGESRSYVHECGWEDDSKKYGCGRLFVFHIDPHPPDVEYFKVESAP